jgi:CD63 antigen
MALFYYMQIGGIALITVGAIPLFRLGDIEAVFPENNPTLIPIAVVILGSIIFIISFFGCCGAIRENSCMVSTYAVFLLVIVVLQVILAVFAFIYASDLAKIAYDGFETLFNQAKDDSQEALIAVEGIQRGLQCCGTTGPSSWTQIPNSCCAAGSNCDLTNSFQNGCSETIYDIVNSSGLIIAWIASVFAGIYLLGVIFSCCLANSIKSARRPHY